MFNIIHSSSKAIWKIRQIGTDLADSGIMHFRLMAEPCDLYIYRISVSTKSLVSIYRNMKIAGFRLRRKTEFKKVCTGMKKDILN